MSTWENLLCGYLKANQLLSINSREANSFINRSNGNIDWNVLYYIHAYMIYVYIDRY